MESSSKDTAKVSYTQADLSAFFIENLTRALKSTAVKVQRQGGTPDTKSSKLFLLKHARCD